MIHFLGFFVHSMQAPSESGKSVEHLYVTPPEDPPDEEVAEEASFFDITGENAASKIAIVIKLMPSSIREKAFVCFDLSLFINLTKNNNFILKKSHKFIFLYKFHEIF